MFVRLSAVKFIKSASHVSADCENFSSIQCLSCDVMESDDFEEMYINVFFLNSCLDLV